MHFFGLKTHHSLTTDPSEVRQPGLGQLPERTSAGENGLRMRGPAERLGGAVWSKHTHVAAIHAPFSGEAGAFPSKLLRRLVSPRRRDLVLPKNQTQTTINVSLFL